MEAAELRSRFRQFAGEDQYRKFVRALNRAGHTKERLLHWQEELWNAFVADSGASARDAHEIFDIFRVCFVHDRELRPPTTNEPLVESQTPPGFREARGNLFPFAIDNTWHCVDCQAARKHWIKTHDNDRPRPFRIPIVRLALFLFAVATLVYYRGFDPSIILMFVLPLMGAFAFSESEIPSYRYSAIAFLALVNVGVVIARTEWLFPDLEMDDQLPPVPNRILAWYGGLYLLYLFSVVPLVVFGGFLIQHSKGKNPGWSRFTCIIGLVLGLILTPFAIGSLAMIGFWPIYRF